MTIRRKTDLLASALLAAALALPGATWAQRDTGRPTPGNAGGSVGGPGMSGAAYSGFSTSALNSGGTGEHLTGGQGSRLTLGQGSLSGGSLQGRFGERGSQTLLLSGQTTEALGAGGWQGEYTRGGFGTLTESPAFLSTLQSQETPVTADASAAYADLTGLSEAQQNAQTAMTAAVEAASTNVGSASATIEQYANQAAETAQAAYDQFWQDYYDAVDYTADTYYQTVTATADSLLASYQEAVDYTTQAVDSYLVYAPQYASYCALYPWDCYSYSYNDTTNTYVYVGGVSAAPVATVQVGTVTPQVALPAVPTPQPSAEAYEAIVLFANDQLGAAVEPRYAGDATNAVLALINRLPPEIQAFVANATTISGADYWALLPGGVAGVMVGDCTTGDCTVTAANLSLQLSSSAAGIYGLSTNAPVPTTAEDALALITSVYPKLAGLAFAQVTDIDAGMSFTASAASLGFDPTTQQPVSVAKVVYAGVVQVNGQPFVYALVATGEGYVDLLS